MRELEIIEFFNAVQSDIITAVVGDSVPLECRLRPDRGAGADQNTKGNNYSENGAVMLYHRSIRDEIQE